MDDTFEVDGVTFRVRTEYDDCHGAPWDEEDGHGPVSDWTSRGKLPGELVLCEDRGKRRYYDFAEACRIARRDGWGFLPGNLKTAKIDGRWHSWIDGRAQLLRRKNGPGNAYRPARRIVPKLFHSVAADINEAIRGTYAQHRATMTARQYAAAAALADFDRLRRWCDNQWHYVGVIVESLDEDEDVIDSASIWGIESDAGDYLDEVAQDLAAELLAA